MRYSKVEQVVARIAALKTTKQVEVGRLGLAGHWRE